MSHSPQAFNLSFVSRFAVARRSFALAGYACASRTVFRICALWSITCDLDGVLRASPPEFVLRASPSCLQAGALCARPSDFAREGRKASRSGAAALDSREHLGRARSPAFHRAQKAGGQTWGTGAQQPGRRETAELEHGYRTHVRGSACLHLGKCRRLAPGGPGLLYLEIKV